MHSQISLSRRSLLLGVMSASVGAILPIPMVRAATGRSVMLEAAPTSVNLLGDGAPKTRVWAYGGQVPGPELRFRQGERLRVNFKNSLEQASTVHWHGIRLPNAMDGVPGLTQEAVAPGETFDYEFDLMDAGTYWYHPHVKSSEQIARGLYGPLIVEEKSPPQVDRDVTWVLDDWRVGEDGQIHDSFGAMHDMSHAGRMGNVASLNGKTSDSYTVRAGERVRLRLINVANARSFALNFENHAPTVIALDGHPVEPFKPNDGRVELGSGQRADLIIDMSGKPGETFDVVDDYYGRQPYLFLKLKYDDAAPLRENPLDTPIALAANPVAAPKADAPANDFVLAGGAMGGMREAQFKGETLSIRDLVGVGKIWAINGVVYDPTNPSPLFTFAKGSSQRWLFKNDTSFPHPIHLHGHVFKIVKRGGKAAEREVWTDTVMIDPGESVEALFVADNPGDWLMHCHVLEHHEAGMAAVVRVV